MSVVARSVDESDEAAPTLRSRLLVASVIALVAAVYSWFQFRYFLDAKSAPDSLFLWRGARMLMEGANPWNAAAWAASGGLHAAEGVAWRIQLADPLFYPMPALLVWLPLALLPYVVATTVFNGVSAFLFAFALTRMGLYRAFLCGSMPFFIAMRFGQWSPLLATAMLMPALGWLLLAKPNLGLPIYLAQPTVAATVGCLALVLIPTLVAPWWVGDWFRNVTQEVGRSAPHPAPVRMFGGWGILLLAGLLRWRRPEARLLVGMACVPQLPYWADQLPLLLAARTRREVLGVVEVTLLGMVIWLGFYAGRGDPVHTMRPLSILCTYVPVLIVVLRRPNVGEPPPLWQALRGWWSRRRSAGPL